jgi:hypothetical protein
MRCIIAISSSGKSLTISKKVSSVKKIIKKKEKVGKKEEETKSGTKLVRNISLITGTVPENTG